MQICTNVRKTLTQLNFLGDAILKMHIMHLYMHYMHYPLLQNSGFNIFVIEI